MNVAHDEEVEWIMTVGWVCRHDVVDSIEQILSKTVRVIDVALGRCQGLAAHASAIRVLVVGKTIVGAS